LEGAGVKAHDNRWWRDIWPSNTVYYILAVGESTPTVVFNLQAALYRVLAAYWRHVVALFVRVVLVPSSESVSPASVVPTDVIALWGEGGQARTVEQSDNETKMM